MIEINNTTRFKINNKLVKQVVEKFLHSYRLAGEDVSIALIGDAKMRRLNHRYRKLDKTTDVLSFENSPLERGGRAARTGCVKNCLDEKGYLGEIVISPAQIKRQARENKNSFQQELIFILVHGLLHLSGYDDRTEKDRLRMINLGEKFIGELGKESKK